MQTPEPEVAGGPQVSGSGTGEGLSTGAVRMDP